MRRSTNSIPAENWEADKLEKAFRALAQEDYSFYCQYVHRGAWRRAKHLDIITDALQRVETGEITHLMMFLPPRHGKSMTATESFPSFFIGKKPERRVISTAYGDSLAQKFGHLNRQKLERFGQRLFGIDIASDNSSKTNWGIQGHRGGMISAGYGGSITGEGADLLFIDDPIKNRAEAESAIFRERLWNEWQNTLLTRLHPEARIIIILTRWHEDDLAGRLLKQDGRAEEGGKWTVIELPAIADAPKRDDSGAWIVRPDMLGREPGQALWPEHGYDEAWAADKKKTVGTYTWEALYQQRPKSPDGGIIKRAWIKYYDRMDGVRFSRILQSWDCSFDEGDTSSYVCGQVWGLVGADAYLLDQVRAQMDFVQTCAAVEAMTAKWPQAKEKLIEKKANGAAVISMLHRKVHGMIPIVPTESKEARCFAVSPFFEAGNVHIPKNQPWTQGFVEELVSFPKPGMPNDQVDCATQALSRFFIVRKGMVAFTC